VNGSVSLEVLALVVADATLSRRAGNRGSGSLAIFGRSRVCVPLASAAMLMRSAVAFATLGSAFAFGCTSLESLSSGKVGCAPEDVTISDESSGYVTTTWRASCHGRVFFCSNDRNGTVSCTEAPRWTDPEVHAPRAKVATTSPAPAAKRVHEGAASFEVPGAWATVEGKTGVLYRSPDGAHTAFVRFAAFSGDAQALAKAKHADREGKAFTTKAEAEAWLSWELGEERRLTTLSLVVDGIGYELTCSDSPPTDKASAACAHVLKSFEVAAP
jgi:hypothetical protein